MSKTDILDRLNETPYKSQTVIDAKREIIRLRQELSGLHQLHRMLLRMLMDIAHASEQTRH